VQAALFGLRYPQFSTAARERYGRTFTVRPGTFGPVVLTSDRDAIRRLLTGDPLRRPHGNEVVKPLIGERSVILLEPAEHLERRKLLLPPFHGERIKGYADLMQRLIDAEIDRWSPGDTVSVLPTAQNLTIEVILQAVLGVRDTATRQLFRRLFDDVLFYPFGPREVPAAAALLTPAVMTHFTGLNARTWWNVGTRPWWRHRDRLMAALDEHIVATRTDPRLADRDDVLAMLVQAGGGLTNDDLRDELVALLGAGHETSASAIAWGAVLLAHNPDVLDQATAGDDAYLSALVKEVLRIRPPVPIGSMRALDEPFAAGEHTIAPGTLIGTDAWGVHHDPELYPDPETFRPERFLGAQPAPYSWLPFGGGAHRCPGAALAELEIKVALRTILRRVRIAPADAGLARAVRRAIVLVPHRGGRIRVA
jgi:cytochrome P450